MLRKSQDNQRVTVVLLLLRLPWRSHVVTLTIKVIHIKLSGGLYVERERALLDYSNNSGRTLVENVKTKQRLSVVRARDTTAAVR